MATSTGIRLALLNSIVERLMPLVTDAPLLANGEFGLEAETGKLKVGDGVTAWGSLPYFTGGSGGPATAIRETGGPTTLNIAAIPDGDFLKRVGATIVGAAGGGGGGSATLTPSGDVVIISEDTPPGVNNDLDLGGNNLVQLTIGDDTNQADITGFAGGTDGRIITLTIDPNTANGVVFLKENTGSQPANRIANSTANASIRHNVKPSVMFVYSGALSRWVCIGNF